MRKFAALAFGMAVLVGVSAAEEFNAIVKKVDGNKITVQKVKKGEKGDEVVLEVPDSAKIISTKLNPDTKKAEPADPLPSGLNNEVFGKDNTFIRVITDEANKVTEIRVLQRKKKE